MSTFGSLFSGIGGFDLGLERAGWECRWQVEIDPFCQRVLAKHWPLVPRYGDIQALDLERLERAELICGGFPCQPVSLAGKGLAKADERWLWPEFARVVRALRPRFVLVENVPGLLGRGFGDVVGDLAQSGYDCEWDCLPASAFGAPHRRDRVWLVAHATGGRDERPVILPRPFLQPERSSEVAHPYDEGESRRSVYAGAGVSLSEFATGDEWWRIEPDVGRVAHGVPARVDRLRGLGNAIVPQVAEWLGRRLLTALHEHVR